MFLSPNRKGNGVAGTVSAAPKQGEPPAGPPTPVNAPAPPSGHGASPVSFGAMAPSLTDAVDAVEMGPRGSRYELLDRVFDGLSAVKDALDRLPPAASVGDAEFVQTLCSTFQELDLTRVIAQLRKLVGLRGDVDRLALSRLEKQLAAFSAKMNDARTALSGPEPAIVELGDAAAGLQGQLADALASLEDRMMASLAAETEDTWMATSRSGIEVPAGGSLSRTLHHGIEGLRTILDKALAVEAAEGKFEAFMRLRRDLQEFDLFRLGQDLAQVKDVQPEILDLLTAVEIARGGWDGSLSRALVEERWAPIEAAIGKLAKALPTAGARVPQVTLHLRASRRHRPARRPAGDPPSRARQSIRRSTALLSNASPSGFHAQAPGATFVGTSAPTIGRPPGTAISKSCWSETARVMPSSSCSLSRSNS